MLENNRLNQNGIWSKAAIAIIVLLTILPLGWIIVLSFKTNNEILLDPLSLPDRISLDNYAEALETIPFLSMLKNTLFVLCVTLPLLLLFSIFAAFAISRNRVVSKKTRGKVQSYFVCGLIIPTCVMLFPIYQIMLKLNLWNTLWSVILPYIGWCAPLSIVILVESFNRVPAALEEAAVIDGCNIFQLLFRVLLPLNRSALTTVFILNFLGIWNDFLLSRVMLNGVEVRTISLAAMYFKGQFSSNYALMTAGVVILIIPQLLIFGLLQKYIVSGAAAGAVKE